MGLSRSAYYRKAKPSRPLITDMELRDKIEEIHLKFPGYGYRRVREHLLREKIRVNGKRIRRIMKKYELFSCLKKWLRPKGAALGKRLVFPNLIGGTKINAPNVVWATDISVPQGTERRVHDELADLCKAA